MAMAQSPSHLDIYYFLSHARTTSPDRWEQQFHEHLDERLRQLAVPTPGLRIASACYATQAESRDPQKQWLPEHARVLVPLYTREYLHDPPQEYEAFLNGQGNGSAQRHLHPVIWDPLPDGRGVQGRAQARSLGADIPDYQTVGLAAMCRLNSYIVEYREIVRRLADRIASTAQHPGRIPLWAGRDSEPGSASPEASFLISVIAPVVGRLPPGRDHASYGPQSKRWSPFRTHAMTVAEYTAGIARGLLMLPEVIDFTAEVAATKEVRDSPGVLLIDPWSLARQDTRAIVRQALADPPPWMSMVLVVDREDPDHEPRGRNLVAEAFDLAAGPVTIISGVHQFEQVIDDLVLRTRRSFLRRQPVNRPGSA